MTATRHDHLLCAKFTIAKVYHKKDYEVNRQFDRFTCSNVLLMQRFSPKILIQIIQLCITLFLKSHRNSELTLWI
jgi:hypothetical protein